MTAAKSQSTKQEIASSNLRAELEHRSGHDPVLQLLLQLKDQPTANDYIEGQWGKLPEEIDEEEAEIIELLRELEKTY